MLYLPIRDLLGDIALIEVLVASGLLGPLPLSPHLTAVVFFHHFQGLLDCFAQSGIYSFSGIMSPKHAVAVQLG